MTRDDLLHLLATDAVLRQVLDIPLASRPQFEIMGRSLTVWDDEAGEHPSWTATLVPPADLDTATWVPHDP